LLKITMQEESLLSSEETLLVFDFTINEFSITESLSPVLMWSQSNSCENLTTS